MELLAPAGSESALRAAVQSGADAVYIGGRNFGARQTAKNFTAEEMRRCVDYCHLYGTDVHVTVNTLIKEKELDALLDYVKELAQIGVDALIVQDLGAAEIIKNTVPDMPLHASTQMSVTTIDEVCRLKKMGFSRVVLARELSEQEIRNICQNTDLEIEVFVHGAICMSYSGKCLMSSILGGRSGNRGRCAQPCRLPYDLIEGHKKLGSGYLLSPKDMALINDLGTLNKIGVTSLKIEGRLKRAEYVSSVVGVYRKYLDMLPDVREASSEDMRILKDAFSRTGFTNGYLKGRLGKDMMSHSSPSGTGDTKYTDEAKLRCAENANVRKIPIGIMGTLKKNGPLEVTFYDNDGNYGYAAGTVNAERAIKTPLDKEKLSAQLLKLGSTPFECYDITVTADDGITIPVKEINAVRRAACDALKAEKKKRAEYAITDYKIPSQKRGYNGDIKITAVVSNDEQKRAAMEAGVENIEQFNPFYKNINVYNSLSADILSENGIVTLSPELNFYEAKELLEHTDAEADIIAYGRLPLMIMKNCPVNSLGFCQNGQSRYALRDRKKEEFPIMCSGLKGECRCVLLNSKPIYMADKIEDIKKLKINGIRLIFTVENFSQCGKIIEEYKRALSGEQAAAMEENTFTRGHGYRGVL